MSNIDPLISVRDAMRKTDIGCRFRDIMDWFIVVVNVEVFDGNVYFIGNNGRKYLTAYVKLWR